MTVCDVTYKNLGHKNPGIYTVAEMSEYSPPKKGMDLESNFALTL